MKNKDIIHAILSILTILLYSLLISECAHEDHSERKENCAISEHNDSDVDHHNEYDKRHGHEESSGAGKAVFKADEKKGIQLSGKALKAIGVRVKSLSRFKTGTGNHYNVPSSSLVYYEDRAGIYIKRGHWFNLIDVRIIRKSKKITTIRTAAIGGHDLIVVHGSALLRLAYLEAFGASGHGHVH